MSKWYKYSQNNSGGSFDIDRKTGIGPMVWIEADSPSQADEKGLSIGMYFDGVERGLDCSCCGDRWGRAETYLEFDEVKINPDYDLYFHPVVYAHHKDGTLEKIT